jgi:hypothetical protein
LAGLFLVETGNHVKMPKKLRFVMDGRMVSFLSNLVDSYYNIS